MRDMSLWLFATTNDLSESNQQAKYGKIQQEIHLDYVNNSKHKYQKKDILPLV